MPDRRKNALSIACLLVFFVLPSTATALFWQTIKGDHFIINFTDDKNFAQEALLKAGRKPRNTKPRTVGQKRRQYGPGINEPNRDGMEAFRADRTAFAHQCVRQKFCEMPSRHVLR
jgi:hypothetical protein